MHAYPDHWTFEQRKRFTPLSELLGVDGLYDALPFVHVSGTNGKGSICAYMQSILRAAGYRVGLFTSPHLYRETDRIRIDDQEIPQEQLNELIKQAYAKNPNIKLFEAYLYAGLLYFTRQNVDIAVMETGIGGTLDATNILWPSLCITGTIGLDHCKILGDTLPEIARQKAGIAKQGVPFVLSPGVDSDARSAFRKMCEEAGAALYDLSGSTLVRYKEDGIQRFDADGPGLSLKDVRIRMLGSYQVQNAWTAAYAAFKLSGAEFKINENVIRQGLWNTLWAGRLQWMDGSPPILVDGAHNPEGAISLKEAVKELKGNRRVVLLIGMMEDKDTQAVAQCLGGAFDAVVATQIDYYRAIPADRLARLFDNAISVTPPETALMEAKRLAGPDGLVVIAGSLYLPSALHLG